MQTVYQNQHSQARFVVGILITQNLKVRFVEVTIPAGLQKQQELKEKNNADFTVEYKVFKITLPTNVDVRTLENILKVVLQADD